MQVYLYIVKNNSMMWTLHKEIILILLFYKWFVITNNKTICKEA